jgi:hypothetical protein
MPFHKRVRRITNALMNRLSHPPIRRVRLWHAGRCGSTVLATLLLDDGRFDWKGEYFESLSKEVELRGADPEVSWQNGLQKLAEESANQKFGVFGIEMKVWQMVRFGISIAETMAILNSIPIQHNIVLKRDSFLRIYLSGRILQASGVSHVTSEQEASRVAIDVDIKNMLAEIDLFDGFYDQLELNLPSETLWLSFEADIEQNPSDAYRKVVSWLGMKPRKVTTPLKRTNNRPIEDMVSNWGEVEVAIQSSKHKLMLCG